MIALRASEELLACPPWAWTFPQYVSLKYLDTIWGIVVEAVAGAGALITLLLMLILLQAAVAHQGQGEKKDPVAFHFLLDSGPWADCLSSGGFRFILPWSAGSLWGGPLLRSASPAAC